MAIAIVVQNNLGTAAGANSYAAVSGQYPSGGDPNGNLDFKSYHTQRGNSYAAYTDDQIATALIRATDYIDTRFQFPGALLNGYLDPVNNPGGQLTQWPRQNVPDPLTPPTMTTNFAYWLDSVWPLIYPGATINGIDPALAKACCEYAIRALKMNLLEDNPANPATKGGGIIDSITTKVDVLEVTRKFRYMVPGAAAWPAYPVADNYLRARGLIVQGSGRVVIR